MAQRPQGTFDIDEDAEYCGVIGGELADRAHVGPAWDWRPDQADATPPETGYTCLDSLVATCTALRGSR